MDAPAVDGFIEQDARSLAAGMRGSFSKPIDSRSLYALVEA